MNITKIILKMYLLDFYERKFNTIVPGSVEILNRYSVESGNCDDRLGMYQQKDSIEKILQNKYPSLYNVLLFGEGKLSICGICIIDLIKDKALIRSKQFHLYVHSCDLDVANTLILKCIELLGNNLLITKDYIDVFGVFGECFMCRIFLTIFKDRDQILKNIGGPPEQHGYDPIAKYFSSMNGTLSLSTRVCPLCFPINEKKILTHKSRFIYPILHWNNPDKLLMSGPVIDIYDCSLQHNFYIRNTSCEQYDIIDENFIGGYNLTLDEVQQLTKIHNNVVIPYLHPSIYYKDYVPTIIGISDDQYVAFNHIRSLFNITNDLFQLLCKYWLSAEVELQSC